MAVDILDRTHRLNTESNTVDSQWRLREQFIPGITPDKVRVNNNLDYATLPGIRIHRMCTQGFPFAVQTEQLT